MAYGQRSWPYLIQLAVFAASVLTIGPPLTAAKAKKFLEQAPGWALADTGRNIERPSTSRTSRKR